MLYMILTSQRPNFEANVEYEFGEQTIHLKYYWKKFNISQRYVVVDDGTGSEQIAGGDAAREKYPIHAIFSDVDINFHSNDLTSVTSLTLDGKKESRRSSDNLPTEIKQLLIDIQALDDADIAYWVKMHPGTNTDKINIHERMPRFTKAFARMFDNLEYSRIQNINGHKAILFTKNGKLIPIDALSSGEKQIVYRGCFLLKDANAMNGAVVFIDEPEISLHPKWQMKVMDYYKGIFTDEFGCQTSQIFAVTYSQKNVIITSVRKYENAKGIRVGIENALVLDNIDLDQFRIEKKTIDDYGGAKVITEFQKMKCCDFICNLERDEQRKILVHLKEEIDTLKGLFACCK